MKEGHGKRYSKACRQWFAYGMQPSRTPLAVRQSCLRLRPRLHLDRNLGRRASRVRPRRADRAGNLHIPGALRDFTGGRSKVEIEHSPATLADALSALWTLYPGVRDRITTEQGQLRQHINVFIGDENVRYKGGLANPVSAGTEISVGPALTGGQ